MPFVPALNTALVEVRCLLDGQKVENTLYFERDTAIDEDGLTTLVNDIRDWWDGSLSPLLSSAVELSEVVATDLTTEFSGQVSIGGGGLVGGNGSLALPNNVSLAVSFRTAMRGRSFRGRNYLMGIPSNQIATVNEVQATYQAEVVTAYDGLLTAALPTDWHWVVVSRISGGVPRSEAQITRVIQVVVVDPTIDSQRRRLPGRGQ